MLRSWCNLRPSSTLYRVPLPGAMSIPGHEHVGNQMQRRRRPDWIIRGFPSSAGTLSCVSERVDVDVNALVSLS